MRFIVLVIGAAATGAVSVASVRTVVAPAVQTFRSTPAPALSDDQPGDPNPISATYDYVTRQITARRSDALEHGFGTAGPVRYFDGGPVGRRWGWEGHRHVPPAREFVHHEVPSARQFVHHDAPPAREFHPLAQHAATGHSGGGGHGGGHGRR